jgi:hypothetical protein
LNRVLPLLSVSNINAATFRVAERTVDAEDAIIAIAQGKPNLRDQYRAERRHSPSQVAEDTA